MKIKVINGPNLNMLGIRQPEIYGNETYGMLCERIMSFCGEKNIDCEILQSNHEGELVDFIQKSYFDGVDALVLNPGGYTHTSVALLDALLAVNIPTVEVHISNPDLREDYRKVSYIRSACVKTVAGHGTDGYTQAIEFILDYYRSSDERSKNNAGGN